MSANSTRALTDQESRRVRARLKELIDAEGSQVAAARKLGISQQVFSRIVGGDAAGLFVAKKVAAFDGVPVEQLLGPAAPSALDGLLRAHGSRWQPYTVAAMRRVAVSTANADGVPEEEWERLLDRIEVALSPIVKDLTARRKR